MAISNLTLFLGSKVKYVGQRSNEGKYNNLSVSSITLHLSVYLKPDLGGRCVFMILKGRFSSGVEGALTGKIIDDFR